MAKRRNPNPNRPSPRLLLLLFFFLSFLLLLSLSDSSNVTYDHRSLIYYFEDRFDLVRFAGIVRDAGLFMILRIGPFVAAEWNFGGVPVWLHYVPGTVFRTNNEPFKSHMKSFTTYVVDMMKRERFFIENEYGDSESAYGSGGQPYAMWAASMALSQNTGVPWIMCQQYDAPDPVINTCNSFYCDQFTPNSPNKPKIWTENWPGWFQTFGDSNPHRPPEDVAFAVAPGASGNGSDSTFKLETPISLRAGKNELAFLSMTVGLQNAGPFYEWVGAGLTSVKINGLKNGTMDLSSNKWIYKIGLEGEYHRIFNPDSRDDIKWMPSPKPPKDQPLIWYKVNVETPKGNDPIGLDMQYMGKGQAWLNGKAIGRYWPRKSSLHDQCTASCNYRGKFSPDKCRTGCGRPTQRWYHVPRSWFQPSGNTLVIFEEKGGDPTKITFARRRVTGVCGYISEDYPSKALESWDKSKTESDSAVAKVSLNCTDGTVISSITFASFGNPYGACRSYQQGSCHYPDSLSVVEKACLHASSCTVSLSEDHFGRDLCPGITKTLAIKANCS
ncbi:Beta-galactosidase 3 [Ananas comosus]|uniref:beta-galactosidase n=1 Tax=Ananas comosus TaxID=4615 RepID=A0A199VND4_ANACO|nr:Beta-galactosidase 3 [Ananas comosus]